MISAKGLIKVIETEGIPWRNKDEILGQLERAINDGRIYIFKNKDNKEIGFVTWLEKHDDGKLFVFVNNLVILKEFKGQYPLVKLRTMLREKYPKRTKFYWRNGKKRTFKYFR
jgi:hypothetical protein